MRWIGKGLRGGVAPLETVKTARHSYKECRAVSSLPFYCISCSSLSNSGVLKNSPESDVQPITDFLHSRDFRGFCFFTQPYLYKAGSGSIFVSTFYREKIDKTPDPGVPLESFFPPLSFAQERGC